MSPQPAATSWILVTDAGFARIFSGSRHDGGLQEIVDFEERGRQDPDTAGYADRRGRVQESANPARHGMEPRTDDKTLRSRRFAAELADFVLEGLRAGRFEHLITSAPPPFATILHDALDPAVKARLTHSENKDLVHESATELYRRLGEDL